MITLRRHDLAGAALAALLVTLGTTAAWADTSGQWSFVDEVGQAGDVELKPYNQAGMLIGSEIRTADGEKIGDVDDLILDGEHRVVAMTVGVGGFLGMDETRVAIPMKRLTIGEDEAQMAPRISTDLTKAEIERAAKGGE